MTGKSPNLEIGRGIPLLLCRQQTKSVFHSKLAMLSLMNQRNFGFGSSRNLHIAVGMTYVMLLGGVGYNTRSY